MNDNPKNREGHWWGEKKFGIIDFAFTDSTGNADVQYSALTERLDSLNTRSRHGKPDEGIRYAAPVAGGRTRPDGEVVKWKVTFPVLNGRQRGELPFFCHDVTPRNVRVPCADINVSHPSKAFGIKELGIFLENSKFPAIIHAYEAILGVGTIGEESKGSVFSLTRLQSVGSAPDPKFQLQIPIENGDIQAMQARSGLFIGRLAFACHKDQDGSEKEVRLGVDDYMGSIVLSSCEESSKTGKN